MRLPGRLSAAIDVLSDIETRKRPVAEALKDWGLAHRFAGAGDRAAIGNLVYDALRRRASHGWLMGSDTPRALVLAVAVFDWGLSVDELNAGFASDPHAPAPIDPAEAERLTAPPGLSDAPAWIAADVPEWVVPMLAGLGEDWLAEAQGMTGRPPLDLRVNALRSDRERVSKSLKRFEPQPTGIAPLGLRMPAGMGDSRTPNVQTDEGYLKGWFEIQDEGSQIVAALTGARPGEQVLDLCAGAGGKTLAMAAAMGNKGQIFAYDADRGRLAPIYERLKRNGVRNAQVRAPGDGALEDLVGRMDRVVVDAPCTGTGTWRRRPDAKWKLTPQQVEVRTAEQAEILAQAAQYVKPGGVIAYITCSVLDPENRGSVEAFLAAHPQFAVRDAGALWQGVFGAERGEKVAVSPWGLTLTPHRTGTDGFFFSLLGQTG